jgi:hypothetical protein
MPGNGYSITMPDERLIILLINRGEIMTNTKRHDWGGRRPNQTGRPPLPEEEKRQKVSTRLGPGYKELAQAIAEVEGLPGWGHAIEQALIQRVEGDLRLRVKLAEMGIIVKMGTIRE